MTTGIYNALLTAPWPDPAPQVVFSEWNITNADVVWVGDSNAGGERIWTQLGNLQVQEAFSIDIGINIEAVYLSAQDAMNRAFDCFAAVQYVLREKGTRGNRTVPFPSIPGVELHALKLVQPSHTWSFNNETGFGCRLTTGVLTTCRLNII